MPGALLLAALLAGCGAGRDYSAYADGSRPLLSRIGSLDARLRELLGDSRPDSGRVDRILDTLNGGRSSQVGAPDSVALDSIPRVLTKYGIQPSIHPSDSDLVPSLAWERRRAGCVPLVLFWVSMARARGVLADPVLLPGHCVLSVPSGMLIETLRGGAYRNRTFYDSAYRLEQRPYYSSFKPDTGAILASMLVQAGLLEWKSGHRVEAASAFQAAAAICPGLPEAEGNLGLVSQEMGREAVAAEHLGIAISGDRLARAAGARLDRLRLEGIVR